MHIEQPLQCLGLAAALALGEMGHAQIVPGFDIVPSQTVFTVTADQAATVSQTLDVGGPIGQKAPFEFALAQVTQQNAPNFIVLTPSKGVAPTLVKLTLNTAVIAGMLPGSYDLSLGIRSTDLANNPGGGGGFVHLLLLPPSSPPSISAVVHGASQQPILSPGELITIYTTNLNIAPISAQSVYPTTLSNTTVTINGVPAPLLYVSQCQPDSNQRRSPLRDHAARGATSHTALSHRASRSHLRFPVFDCLQGPGPPHRPRHFHSRAQRQRTRRHPER